MEVLQVSINQDAMQTFCKGNAEPSATDDEDMTDSSGDYGSADYYEETTDAVYKFIYSPKNCNIFSYRK